MVIFFGSLRDCGHHNIIMWKQQCQHLAKHPLWKKNHGFGTIWVRVKDDNFHFWWNIITTRYHIFPSINRKVETKKIHYLNIPNKTTITQHHWVYWCIKHAESRENSKKFHLRKLLPQINIWQDLQCSKNHRASLALHYSDSLLLTAIIPNPGIPSRLIATLPHLLRDEEVMMNVCSLVITILIIFQRAGGRVLAFHLRFYWVTLSWSTRGRCCWPEL